MSISGWELRIGWQRDYTADWTAGQRKPPKVMSSTSVLLGPLGLLESKGRIAAPSLVFVPMIAGFPCISTVVQSSVKKNKHTSIVKFRAKYLAV